MARLMTVIPAPDVVWDAPTADGASIRVRHHGNRSGPRLFILHGNGYASDGYFPFWRNFLDAFEIVVFDLRNHGQNPRSDVSAHNFQTMVQDLDLVVAGVVQRFGAKTAAGVFHSTAGLIAAQAVVEFGRRWDALVLVDPPAVPPPAHSLFEKNAAFEDKLVQFALNRRNRFHHPDELAEEFRKSRACAKWSGGSHELMAQAVLRKDEGASDYVLTCSPELEADMYREVYRVSPWPKAADLQGPVLLFGSDPLLPYNPPTAAANQALATEGGFPYATIPGTGHTLQLEEPMESAKLVRDYFSGAGIA